MPIMIGGYRRIGVKPWWKYKNKEEPLFIVFRLRLQQQARLKYMISIPYLTISIKQISFVLRWAKYMLCRKTENPRKHQANFFQLTMRSMKAAFYSQLLIKVFLVPLAGFLVGLPCFHLITVGLTIGGAKSKSRNMAMGFSG